MRYLILFILSYFLVLMQSSFISGLGIGFELKTVFILSICLYLSLEGIAFLFFIFIINTVYDILTLSTLGYHMILLGSTLVLYEIISHIFHTEKRLNLFITLLIISSFYIIIGEIIERKSIIDLNIWSFIISILISSVSIMMLVPMIKKVLIKDKTMSRIKID